MKRDDLYFSVTPQQWDAYAAVVAETVRLNDADRVGYISGEQWRIADPALVPHLLDQTRARNAELRRLAYNALQSVIRQTGDAAASQALVAMARGTPARADVRHLLAALEDVTDPVVLTGTIIPAVLAERRHPAHYEALKLAGRCPDEDVVVHGPCAGPTVESHCSVSRGCRSRTQVAPVSRAAAAV